MMGKELYMKSVRHRSILAVILAGLVAGVAAPRAEVIEQILVKVNGEIFTKSDLEARQIVALRQTGQQVDPSKVSDLQLRKMLNDVTPALMVNVVDEFLL